MSRAGTRQDRPTTAPDRRSLPPLPAGPTDRAARSALLEGVRPTHPPALHDHFRETDGSATERASLLLEDHRSQPQCFAAAHRPWLATQERRPRTARKRPFADER